MGTLTKLCSSAAWPFVSLELAERIAASEGGEVFSCAECGKWHIG